MASIFKTSEGSWRAQIRRKGLPSISQNFPSKVEAQRWAREQEHKLDTSKSVPKGLHLTLADVLDAYEEAMRGRRMGRSKKMILGWWRRDWGAKRLDELTKQAVINYATKRANGGARPATVAQDLAYYKTVLRFGGPLVDAEEQCAFALLQLQAASDVLKHLGKIGPSRERDRRPTDDEFDALFSYFDNRWYSTVPMSDIVRFAVATCMRQGEIVGPGGLLWSDLNIEARTVLVRQRKHPTKMEDNHDLVPLLRGPCVIMNEIIDPLEIILRQPRLEKRIFPYSENSVGQAFTEAVRFQEIDNLHFHDLRHDGISRLFEAGYQIPEVSLVSGHKNWKHLQRYTQIRPHTLHRTNGEAQVS